MRRRLQPGVNRQTLWRVICNTLRHPRALLIGMGLALVPRTLVYSLRRRSILTHA